MSLSPTGFYQSIKMPAANAWAKGDGWGRTFRLVLVGTGKKETENCHDWGWQGAATGQGRMRRRNYRIDNQPAMCCENSGG